MATRLPALRIPPIAFAHRGARAHAPDNTLEAFSLALRLGASGLETDAWITSDGVAVLDHDGRVSRSGASGTSATSGASGRLRRVSRRRPIRGLVRAALPPSLPSLAELYEACGTGFELSVDVKDEAAVSAIVAAARAAGDGAPGRLWLCHPSWTTLAAWRSQFPDVRLVDSTRLRRLKEGPERRADALARAGIDAINMHHSDWSGGLTTLFHRFDVLAFAWDAQFERVIDGLIDMGIDGIHSDHVDRLVDAIARRR